jgi:predicted nucleic acid-binding Zn ribbon protein
MMYIYRCPVCGNRQIHSHSMKADPPVRCNKVMACGARCGALMTKVITGGAGYIMADGTRGKKDA